MECECDAVLLLPPSGFVQHGNQRTTRFARADQSSAPLRVTKLWRVIAALERQLFLCRVFGFVSHETKPGR